MSIGENIKHLRQVTMVQRAMTQAELGKAIGVSSQCVAQWEKGKNSPNVKYLAKLAGILGVTIDSLVTGSFHD